MLFVAHDDCPLVRAETISVSSQGRFFGCIETVWKLWSRSDQTWSMDGDERSYGSSPVQAVARRTGRARALIAQVKTLFRPHPRLKANWSNLRKRIDVPAPAARDVEVPA
jgi:hypothetical protein